MNMNSSSSSTNYLYMDFVPQHLLDLSVPVPVLVSVLTVGRSLIFASILALFLTIWSKSRIFMKPKLLRDLKPKQDNNFPPGPRSLLAALRNFRHILFHNNFALQLEALEIEYGKIVGCFVRGFTRFVYVSDVQVLKTAFNNPALLGRPPQKYFQLFRDGIYRGIALTSGETWKEMRSFTVSQLRNLGMGKKTLEPAICQQVEECIAILRTKMNTPFSSKHFFDVMVFNVLWRIISGQKFSPRDPLAQKLVNCAERVTMVHQLVFTCQPKWGARLLFLFGMENPFPEIHKQFRGFTSQFLNTRLKSFTSTSQEEYADFTEAFLHKIQSTEDINSPFYGQTGYENLQETIRDLFVAGTDSTGTTLSWALLFLALHPEKQEKLQGEIHHVLGNRTPTLDDRSAMKFTEAVINETLRKSSVVPLGIPHAAMEDTTIGHFDVPKDTTVILNIHAIHHCEETWGDPHSFRPERFLNEDETSLIKYEEFCPFGIGRRMCPGMALAYSELFMFITRIFQEFTITWNPAERKPTMEMKVELNTCPLIHTLIINRRTKSTINNQQSRQGKNVLNEEN